MKNINFQIVNLRAIAIILVVLGHSMMLYANWEIFTSVEDYPILAFIKNKIINPFQLSIFFAVSGWLYAKTNLNKSKLSFRDFCNNKIKRLLIPYFVVALFYMDPIKFVLQIPNFENIQNLLISIFKQLIFSGSAPGHLWFLPCLFFIFIIAYISFDNINTKHKTLIAFITLLILNRLSSYLPSLFMINSVLYYLIYFYLGHFIYKIQKNDYFKNIVNKHKVLSTTVLFIFIICAITIPSYYKIVFITLSIILLFFLIPNKKNSLLNYISTNSFGIYLFHSPFIYITFKYLTNYNPIIVISINFIVFGCLSILITELIRKTKYKFIIGE